MKKLFFSLLFVVVACCATPALSVEVSIGPDEMIMKTPAGKKPAIFPHRKHQEIMACMQCHHVTKGIMTIRKCSICHNEKMENTAVNTIKKAAHKQCRGCHKTKKKEHQKGTRYAPLKCSGCHPLNIKK
jgi:hypothetical protein